MLQFILKLCRNPDASTLRNRSLGSIIAQMSPEQRNALRREMQGARLPFDLTDLPGILSSYSGDQQYLPVLAVN